MISLSDILEKVRSLPSLSTSVARLSQVVRDEKASAADLEKAIRPDPALTANLLRVANSAAVAPRLPITSVRHAIVMLGSKQVFELATAASYAQVIPSRIAGYDMSATEFWTHSIAVATLAERLGDATGYHADSAFTAGLLHDLGKLVLGSYLATCEDQVLDRVISSQVEFVTAEREALGVDHTEAGGAIAQSWRLPEFLVMCAVWHHRPEDERCQSHRSLVRLVHVADALAHSFGLGTDRAGLARKLDDRALAGLGLRARKLESIASLALSEIGDLVEALGVPHVPSSLRLAASRRDAAVGGGAAERKKGEPKG